ncbi:hypothetical protein KKC91_08920 [bacterium]|nr:hypothetical protein [bacterium]
MSLLGIDVGTTGCKAAAFSEDGICLASAYREYDILHSRPDWAELDSQEVLTLVKSSIAEVAAQTRKDPISALSVSSMGEAMTPVTEDRKILGNCILSSDIRGGEHIESLSKEIDQQSFYEINPNILGLNYSLPKLLWLHQYDPECYAKTYKFLLWGDLITFMLGGEAVTSYSLANRTLFFDIRKEDWSDKLLTINKISREKLPKPVPSGTIAGTVSNLIAKELNLDNGVKIVVGGHDQCCNSLGAGIYQPGTAVCGIGTFECITPTYNHIPDSSLMIKNGLNIEHHVLPNLFVSFVYNQAGSLVRWFRDTFASADKKIIKDGYDIYERLSNEMPVEPSNLLVLPYFEMTGPPDFISDASGVIVGLKTSTTRGEILKAIMECVAFYFVDNLNALKEIGIDTSEFVATGGGAKSSHWLQIKADIFGIPFVRPCITEASILGAAILAGISTGVFKDPGEGVRCFVRRDTIFEPNSARHKIYLEKLEKYRELFPLLKDFLLSS